MKISDLERRLKRQLVETVASNDTVVELPVPGDYKAWQAQYRKHIRCMIWWKELSEPTPELGRSLYMGGFSSDRLRLYYPWFQDKGEWRTRKMNVPKSVLLEEFKGDRLIRVPGLRVPDRGILVLDGAHRLRDLEPLIVVVDWIQVTKDRLCSIADTIGAWWQV
jgi:hypothetical protein